VRKVSASSISSVGFCLSITRKITHAAGPGGADNFFCGGARYIDLAAAQGGTAKAELGYLQARVPDLSLREFSRLTVLRSGRSGGHTGWQVR
jgi:hypothetical protein